MEKYFGEKWSQLEDHEKKEIKDHYGGPGTGAKDKWQADKNKWKEAKEKAAAAAAATPNPTPEPTPEPTPAPTPEPTPEPTKPFYEKGNEPYNANPAPPAPPPSYNNATPTPSASKEDFDAQRAEAGKGSADNPNNNYANVTDWSKHMSSKAMMSGAAEKAANDPRLQEMVFDPHTGKQKNKYAIMYNSGNVVENPALHSQEFADEYKKSGKIPYHEKQAIYDPHNFETKKGFGADGSLTAKQVEDMGYTPHLYRQQDYQQHANAGFDNPHSAEAIQARQNFQQNEMTKNYHTGQIDDRLKNKYQLNVYDPSANEGYDNDLTPGQQLKQWHMSKAYKQQLESDEIEMPRDGGYVFDMTKNAFVPNEATRQRRAQQYDTAYMQGRYMGDRYAYIHQIFDPYGGQFEYDNTYDMKS